MSDQPSFTDLTLAIQAKVGRPDTLRLLKRAGQAARASQQELAPIHVLLLLQKRLDEGYSVKELVKLSNGKLIRLARSFVPPNTIAPKQN